MDGSAVSPDDYTAANGTVTITAGNEGGSFEVTLFKDDLDELDEDFTVTLSNPENCTIADGEATGTIKDDDEQPSISINDITVSEADATATFTVSLSDPSGLEVKVDWVTADGTATAGEDYEAGSGTVTFAPGEDKKTVNSYQQEFSYTKAPWCSHYLVGITSSKHNILYLWPVIRRVKTGRGLPIHRTLLPRPMP